MMKAGKYTAALMLLAAGTALAVDLATGRETAAALLRWWPVVLIALGVEYLIFSLIHRDPGQKLGVAFGSLLFAAVISAAALAAAGAWNLQPLRDWAGEAGSFGSGLFDFGEERGNEWAMEPVRVAVDGSVASIVLRNPYGSVTVRTDDVDDIEVRGTVFVPKAKADGGEVARASEVRIERKKDRLELAVKARDYRILVFRHRPRVNLTVTVPRGLESDWHFELANGKVDAAGLSVRDRLLAETMNGEVVLADIAGNVKADTINGGIAVRNVRGDVIANTTFGRVTVEQVSGSVTADTAHGKVELRDIGGRAVADTTNGEIILERIGGDVAANTTNGAVTVTEAGGSVKADTTNGDVTVSTSTVAGHYRLDSTNGNIRLHVPDDASIEVEGETSWGTIETDLGLETAGKEVRGIVNGGTYRISIQTNRNIGIYAN